MSIASSSSSICAGEKGVFSPKWAAGTDEDMGVNRGFVRCWCNRDAGGVDGGFVDSKGTKGDDED